MTTYLIVYGRDLDDRFAAYRFENRADAIRPNGLVPSVPVDGNGSYDPTREPIPGVGGCHMVLETEEEAARNVGGPAQVALYNRLTGEAVTRFADRVTGGKRLLAALAKHAIEPTGANAPIVDAPTDEPEAREVGFDPETVTEAIALGETLPEEKTVNDEIPTNQAEPPKRRGGRVSAYHPDQMVTVLVTENPKKPGKNNHRNYQAMLDLPASERTVGKLLSIGVTVGDLRFNEKHAYIQIGAPPFI